MKKFDFCIGNPAYQEETDSESTRKAPIYNSFMDEAYKIAEVVEGLLSSDSKDVKHHMNVLGFGGDMTPSEVMAGHIIKMAKRGE